MCATRPITAACDAVVLPRCHANFLLFKFYYGAIRRSRGISRATFEDAAAASWNKASASSAIKSAAPAARRHAVAARSQLQSTAAPSPLVPQAEVQRSRQLQRDARKRRCEQLADSRALLLPRPPCIHSGCAALPAGTPAPRDSGARLSWIGARLCCGAARLYHIGARLWCGAGGARGEVREGGAAVGRHQLQRGQKEAELLVGCCAVVDCAPDC